MSIFAQHDEIARDLAHIRGSRQRVVINRTRELLAAYRERLHEVETGDITVLVQELAEARDQVAQLSAALVQQRASYLPAPPETITLDGQEGPR